MLNTVADVAKLINDEEAATDLIEKLRWPEGPVCPFCGSKEASRLNVKGIKRRRYKCRQRECRKQFTVSVGTIFEDSHIPFGKWLYVIYQMCVAKKGVSANQIKAELGITYKSAWFMCHRVRFAMGREPLADKLAGVVEIDETYVGGRGKGKRGRGSQAKTPVVSLIQRDGDARSFVVDNVKGETLKSLARNNVEMTSHIMTDSFRSYRGLDKEFASHQAVDHSKEYVRGIVHTNFAESYFSLLKRGVVGTFHHISKQHMPFYLNEFDCRWNSRKESAGERTAAVIKGFEGKRLTYKQPVAKKRDLTK